MLLPVSEVVVFLSQNYKFELKDIGGRYKEERDNKRKRGNRK